MAREAKYPAQISALVEQDTRDRIDALERTYAVSAGEVIREALQRGLASVEHHFVRERMMAERRNPSRDLEPVEVMTAEGGGEL